jgi:hypothetical protein
MRQIDPSVAIMSYYFSINLGRNLGRVARCDKPLWQSIVLRSPPSRRDAAGREKRRREKLESRNRPLLRLCSSVTGAGMLRLARPGSS